MLLGKKSVSLRTAECTRIYRTGRSIILQNPVYTLITVMNYKMGYSKTRKGQK